MQGLSAEWVEKKRLCECKAHKTEGDFFMNIVVPLLQPFKPRWMMCLSFAKPPTEGRSPLETWSGTQGGTLASIHYIITPYASPVEQHWMARFPSASLILETSIGWGGEGAGNQGGSIMKWKKHSMILYGVQMLNNTTNWQVRW